MTKYIEIEERNGMISMDGYTTLKTFEKAVLDIAKAVSKINKNEADALIGSINYGESPICQNIGFYEFCFEMEEVGCATKYDESKDEMVTSEGAWYFHIRFMK